MDIHTDMEDSKLWGLEKNGDRYNSLQYELEKVKNLTKRYKSSLKTKIIQMKRPKIGYH